MAINRILVVDDSPTEQHYFRELLAKQGYQVITAETGERAIELARSELPDLILMDVIMPGMNGFQATRTIKRDQSIGHIPVIMCTTKDQETDRIWGMRQGARDYLIKPVSEAALLSKIRALG